MKIKLTLPWWLKIVFKIFLSRLPLNHSFWNSIGLFKHGLMDTPEYAIRVFEQHVKRAGLQDDLEGKVIMEIGCGDSIATAIIAFAHGARAICIDVDRFAVENAHYYSELCSVLRSSGLCVPDITEDSSLDEILAGCNGQYLTEGTHSLKSIDEGSVDLIFSHAVLEHIRIDEFSSSVREWLRILKTNGLASHNVDLKDHLGGELNNLRFSSSTWESDFFCKEWFLYK